MTTYSNLILDATELILRSIYNWLIIHDRDIIYVISFIIILDGLIMMVVGSVIEASFLIFIGNYIIDLQYRG